MVMVILMLLLMIEPSQREGDEYIDSDEELKRSKIVTYGSRNLFLLCF
ncbi:hypothetical protein RchiOBHm_Chr1g0328611 [Rosa chinensis]|uniref:Uncharacterized protein n=1 Tax=Rosa chinensis TaxID=74649 RepID=A0A2P6SAX2_ROSCH|nr:hypothetical protein RchiOBHm_Chr1g0328611 [Rosa chinensis]